MEHREIHKAAYPLMFMENDIMELIQREDQKVIDIIALIYQKTRENNTDRQSDRRQSKQEVLRLVLSRS